MRMATLAALAIVLTACTWATAPERPCYRYTKWEWREVPVTVTGSAAEYTTVKVEVQVPIDSVVVACPGWEYWR